MGSMDIRFSSTVEELQGQLRRIGDALRKTGEDPGTLSVVLEADRDHMQHPEFRDNLISAHGFRYDMPFVEFLPGIERDSNSDVHGYGFVIYETGVDEQTEKPIQYVILNIPSEIKEYSDTYLVVSKALLQPLLGYWERLDIPEMVEETVKPILDAIFLKDIIDSSFGFLMKREEIEKYNVKLRRGILLDGDPGNGKTMTMRYIRQKCQENNIHTRNVTAAQLMSAFQEDELEEFMSCAPVMFFDDIDVSFFNRKRTEGGDGRMCCALLSAMDGMSEGNHCIRIFSTNERVEDMDPAFKRPGRIDRIFSFKLPEEDKRLELVKTWHEEILKDVPAEEVARRTEGMSFAETDSIKDLLVTNKIFGDGTWNLDRAFEMYDDTKIAKVEIKDMKDKISVETKNSEDEGKKPEDKKCKPVLVDCAQDSRFPGLL